MKNAGSDSAYIRGRLASRVRIRGTVSKFTDGDSIKVMDGAGTEHTIRFNGIDCPEMAQDFGPEAKQHLERLIGSERVTLQDYGKDRYDRTLADVFVGDELINLAMVRDVP